MKHSVLKPLAAAGLALFLSVPVYAEPAKSLTAQGVMLANEVSRKSITEQSSMQMTLTNANGDARVREVLMLIDDTNSLARKIYLKFNSPRDVKDVRILTLEHENANEDDDRWLFLPALKKVRRISASSKGESFMGTDFSYEDFEVKDGVVGSKNHTYKFLREETIPDALGVKKLCWVIEALPSTEQEIRDSENSKRIIWVEQQHFAAIQEHYFNKSGVLFKVRTSSDVRPYTTDKSKTVWRPMRIEMTTVESGHKTTLIMNDFKVDQTLPTKIFTRQYVETGEL
ncbi:outer membrane lipoprotein-sorting protein [Andreprevotia chitinilytica]|uniref:outer membrane lipoprotein-sorting protein n=1 Tax=Andreprevotia chitinilytica TaxID=396808 RepID=UPI00068EB347|nr:outer membrane lipoprotein-sorting protein [Andreprevotia chitinilytica]